MAGVNSHMAMLCSILLSFPEVILTGVPNISGKDNFKDVLITLPNRFPGIFSLSEPSSIAQFSIKGKFQDR